MDEGHQFKGRPKDGSSPDYLYTGSTADLRPGDKIKPAKVTGNSVHGDSGADRGEPAREHAFATEDENVAWSFADMASNRLNDRRQKVYKVKKHPEMRKGTAYDLPDDYNKSRKVKEWVAPEYEVVDRIDVMPGRQGTIPGTDTAYDWRHMTKRSTGHPMTEYESNHPDLWQYGEKPQYHKRPEFKPSVHEGQMDLFTGKTVREHLDDNSFDYDDDSVTARLAHSRQFHGYMQHNDPRADRSREAYVKNMGIKPWEFWVPPSERA